MDNVLFQSLDPRMIDVLLHRSRYFNHIWPNHPMVGVDDIQMVIDDPDIITQDVTSLAIENYYRQDVFDEYPDLYLKACVLFKPPEQGRVVTAFAVDWPKPEEEIIWQK